MVFFGTMAAVIGLVLSLLPGGQASFGWFASVPLSDPTFFPPCGFGKMRRRRAPGRRDHSRAGEALFDGEGDCVELSLAAFHRRFWGDAAHGETSAHADGCL